MKKIFSLFLGITILGLVLSGCSPKDSMSQIATGNQTKTIKSYLTDNNKEIIFFELKGVQGENDGNREYTEIGKDCEIKGVYIFKNGKVSVCRQSRNSDGTISKKFEYSLGEVAQMEDSEIISQISQKLDEPSSEYIFNVVTDETGNSTQREDIAFMRGEYLDWLELSIEQKYVEIYNSKYLAFADDIRRKSESDYSPTYYVTRIDNENAEIELDSPSVQSGKDIYVDKDLRDDYSAQKEIENQLKGSIDDVNSDEKNEEKVRLIDNANLLEDKENEEILTKLNQVSEKHSMDVVVLTVDELDGKTTAETADDYYDDNGYANDGLLLLISMEERDWHISTKGAAIELFSDDIIKKIGEEISGDLGEGYYKKAFLTYINLCDKIAEGVNVLAE